MGTPAYMSPEQASGRGQDECPATDVWSMGATLYEMLTGTRAFKGNSSAETMASILRDQPNDLNDSGRRIPLGIDPIVRRCL